MKECDRVLGHYATQKLTFAGDKLIDLTEDPEDPILGRGEVNLGAMVRIGLRTNGTVSLSDTDLRIVDSTNGDVLLNGFVFEAAHMPSSVPGFPFVIQAYLDIPPASVGGIQNTIGSAFLAGLQQVSEQGHLTMLWFYPDQPLFDVNGEVQIPPTGMTGLFLIGVAEATGVPVSSQQTLGALALLLLIGGATVLQRRRVAPRAPAG